MAIEIIQTVITIPRTLVTIETLSPIHAVPPQTEIEIGLPVETTVKTIGTPVAETRPLDLDEIVAVKAGKQTSVEGRDHPRPTCNSKNHSVSKCPKATCFNCDQIGHLSYDSPMPTRINVHFSQRDYSD